MSFISTEPQSRIVLESHNNSLLAQFDTQFRIIADRYLAFFRERRNIEATYIDSLRKLHRKARTVDASFDPLAEPTTARIAWDNVIDNLRRDADAQQVFVDNLARDVIKPLEILMKESRDKVINRTKSNLDKSTSLYADHAENKVSNLQQAYLRKYQSQQYAYSTNVSRRPQDIPSKRFGSRVPTLFRGRREQGREASEQASEPSDEGSADATYGFQLGLRDHPFALALEDDCREAVASLNIYRLFRADSLRDGYALLEELVFTPTIKDVLVKYMDGVIKSRAAHNDIAKSTGAEVVNALGGRNASDLRASFRRAIAYSTPPRTLYCNYRPGVYSNLIFGVPLVDLGLNDDEVPKVMRMCIDEVEKRGLHINKIYSSPVPIRDPAVRKLLRRYESGMSFSFTSGDSIYYVAALLKRYLHDLPEPLFALSMQELTQYTQERVSRIVRHTENNISLLRSKIRELPPVHRASLDILLQHLLLVAAHSDKNGMTVKALSSQLYQYVFGYDTAFTGEIDLKRPVMEDIIQNAQTLFDERPESDMAQAMSTYTYGGSLPLSPELPHFDVQAMGSTIPRRRPGIFGDILPSPRSPGSVSSDSLLASATSLQTKIFVPPSPLLVLESSTSLNTEEVETAAEEELIPDARAAEACTEALPHSTPPGVDSFLVPTSLAEWLSHQSLFSTDVDGLRPPSLSESIPSRTSDFLPPPSDTSSQTTTSGD